MAKKNIDPNIEPGSDGDPYDAPFCAEKHKLTLKAAEVVLRANGPSRTTWDAAAMAFVAALGAGKKPS